MVHCSQTKTIAQGWEPNGPVLGAELSRIKRICRTLLCFTESFSNSLHFQENKCTHYTEQFCHQENIDRMHSW